MDGKDPDVKFGEVVIFDEKEEARRRSSRLGGLIVFVLIVLGFLYLLNSYLWPKPPSAHRLYDSASYKNAIRTDF